MSEAILDGKKLILEEKEVESNLSIIGLGKPKEFLGMASRRIGSRFHRRSAISEEITLFGKLWRADNLQSQPFQVFSNYFLDI
jgi:hypothetical protein